MAIVTVKEVLQHVSDGWAVGAFNVHNLDDVRAVVEAADELRSPVILMASQSALSYAGVAYLGALMCEAASAVQVPVAVQLDHGQSFELAVDCMRHGFSGVMFDGSQLPFGDNVALTKKVVEVARVFDVSVEGELGVLGGKEDDLVVDDSRSTLTNSDEAVRFVEETEIDVLAPSVGTAHGFYKRTPNIDFERLQEICRVVGVPVALHGSSGLSTDVIKRAISCGVKKVNIGTDLKSLYTTSLRDFLVKHPEEHEPRKVFAYVRDELKSRVKYHLQLLGSIGRAN